MSSPARGSRTSSRVDHDTPSRRSTRGTPAQGSQTPTRDEDLSRTPRNQRTPAKRRATPGNSDGVEGTPMRWGAPRNGHDGSSDVPATSPAPNIIPTSPARKKNYQSIFISTVFMLLLNNKI